MKRLYARARISSVQRMSGYDSRQVVVRFGLSCFCGLLFVGVCVGFVEIVYLKQELSFNYDQEILDVS